MKELKLAFQSLAEGLRIFAKSLEVLADQVNAMGGTTKTTSKGKPAKPAAPKKSPASAPKKAATQKAKKAPSKKAAPKPKKPAKAKKSAKTSKTAPSGATSVETVYGIIARSKKGVSSAQICSETGYNAKKVANVVYKLKNRDQIKAIKKGVYVKK